MKKKKTERVKEWHTLDSIGAQQTRLVTSMEALMYVHCTSVPYCGACALGSDGRTVTLRSSCYHFSQLPSRTLVNRITQIR